MLYIYTSIYIIIIYYVSPRAGVSSRFSRALLFEKISPPGNTYLPSPPTGTGTCIQVLSKLLLLKYYM